MRKILLITIALVSLTACSSKNDSNNEEIRWPDFLRDWAAAHEINDTQRLSLIDLIDSVYRCIEDTTLSIEPYSDKICNMVDRISEVIINDSSFEFTLMMRATAANFWGYSLKDRRFFDCECSGLILNAYTMWQVISTSEIEFMAYTIIPVSWQAPAHFANIAFVINEEEEEPMSAITITNYDDYLMDSIRVAFIDENGIILNVLDEEDVWVDSTNAKDGIKTLLIPYDELMQALSYCKTMAVSYQTTNGLFAMRGYPGAKFNEYINDCPRLKSALKYAMTHGESITPITDEILNKNGQPVKRVENRTTGEVFNFDDTESTWYLDTVRSEEFGAYYLQYSKKNSNILPLLI